MCVYHLPRIDHYVRVYICVRLRMRVFTYTSMNERVPVPSTAFVPDPKKKIKIKMNKINTNKPVHHFQQVLHVGFEIKIKLNTNIKE
jgi:hypothetical protein